MYEEKRREEQSRGKRIKSSSVDITLEYKQGDLGSVVLFVEDPKVDGFFFWWDGFNIKKEKCIPPKHRLKNYEYTDR